MRGRPPKSKVRQNIIEILYFLEKSHGYQISKIYKEIFPSVTTRLIYYHLKKGVSTGEFRVAEIKNEVKDYSWGKVAELIFYELGDNATPKIPKKVENYFRKTGWNKH